ncbi:DUF305 domain-containing protein [Streptomyces daliensis]
MTVSRSTIRRSALAAASVAAALTLSACGGGAGGEADSGARHDGHASASASPSGKAEAGTHNKADVAFAAEMIPHHRQAVEMSRLADSRASSGEVKRLATKIEKAQGPEIETMSGWLKAWGEKVPEDMSGSGHEGMDHGDMGHGEGSEMPGMMDQKQMDELEKSSGEDFDRQFLTMMIGHHEGAVEMARTEKKKGAYEPATSLADDVITAQNREIRQMRELLKKG